MATYPPEIKSMSTSTAEFARRKVVLAAVLLEAAAVGVAGCRTEPETESDVSRNIALAIQDEIAIEQLLAPDGQRSVQVLYRELKTPGLYALVYELPTAGWVYRECYVQHDGLVLLAGHPYQGLQDTRWDCKPVRPEQVDRSQYTLMVIELRGSGDSASARRQRERQERVAVP
ncbi:MAG: hypothetical protein HY720_26285 [Planctomycetes bacterium]|nr:hypothetical protein [Planctomycetota bacterium]